MTAVVDSSVIVAALIDSGSESSWAESAIAQGRVSGPELALVESGNILRRLERAGRILPVEASLAHADLLRLDIELAPYAPFADRVWELRADLTCHDAWHVALAEALDCPLFTLDRRLARAAGPTCEIITPSAS